MEDIGIQNFNRWIAFGNKFIFQNIWFHKLILIGYYLYLNFKSRDCIW